ncbi:hypothetical protein DPMN_112117 [Dreissena polymorpha]|uniref:ZP domain-containing protein n=1 Tax=Dreissena polymorpha TaxID=45954 RepID=A0A9D4KFT8_DREPO|nr:hypothetical protein DPMN_112117 [Dreissena polymorpha]
MPSTLTVDIPMSACGITWEEEFSLRFTRLEGFEGFMDDLQSRLKCKRLTSQFVVTNTDVLTNYGVTLEDDELSLEHNVQIAMYLHQVNNKSAVISNAGIIVRTPVSLAIEIDALYKTDFDVIPLMCSANGITILGSYESLVTFSPDKTAIEMPGVSCAKQPFSNFQRVSPGHYRSDFTMFRTTRNGISDNFVNFECLLNVCRVGECPTLTCIPDL